MYITWINSLLTVAVYTPVQVADFLGWLFWLLIILDIFCLHHHMPSPFMERFYFILEHVVTMWLWLVFSYSGAGPELSLFEPMAAILFFCHKWVETQESSAKASVEAGKVQRQDSFLVLDEALSYPVHLRHTLLMPIKTHKEWRQEMPLWCTRQATLPVPALSLACVMLSRGLVASAVGSFLSTSFSIQYSGPAPRPFSFIPTECSFKSKTLLIYNVLFQIFFKNPIKIFDIDWTLDRRHCYFPCTCYFQPIDSGYPSELTFSISSGKFGHHILHYFAPLTASQIHLPFFL